MVLPFGSLANAGAIVAGGLVGLTAGAKLSAQVREIVFQGLGLAVLLLGVRMALPLERPLLVVLSLSLGAALGQWLKLEDRFTALGERLKAVVGSRNPQFTAGLVGASLIYCIGSMAIVGAIDEGLRGDPTVLYAKAVLDGFAAVALAATYGSGVLLSCVPVFCYQYGLSLLAVACAGFFTPSLIAALSAMGGLLIMGIGLNVLGIATICIGNMLPALFIFLALWQAWP